MNILPILVERGLIAEKDVAAIQAEAAENTTTIEEVLHKRGIDAKNILAVKGEYLNLPTKLVPEEQIPFEVLQYIPEESAFHYSVVPLAVTDGVLEVGMLDPDNIEALDALNFISAKINLPFKVFLITQEDFERVLKMYKGIGGDVNNALSEIAGDSVLEDDAQKIVDLNEKEEQGQVLEPGKEGNTIAHVKEDAPVTKIVATTIRNAVEGRASDIHIENTGEKVRVRFRVDGVLHTSILLPPKVHRAMVSRIKILASLKLDERRKPQDGRFSATISGRKVDFRVSTFPTHYGEKVVLRILDKEKGVITLDDSGMRPHFREMVQKAVQKPYGMILITGPTGSGKSTTLYGMLSEVDTEGKNVLSLEDPVEYNIPGMSQSQVRPEIGYTFASGLRSILRQDPDIIMVGEIRDGETAQLAIQAALTGHLVLSTLHTNTAIGAIPRLIDMGVDPYLIAPTLELLIAQRLVRRICPGTGKVMPTEGSIQGMIDEQFNDLPEQYKTNLPLNATEVLGLEATGDCPSGTRGRSAVFEMLEIDRELETAIINNEDENKLYDIARKNGMTTMREDAILKAINKEIPFEEVNTVGSDAIFEEEEEPEAVEVENIDEGVGKKEPERNPDIPVDLNSEVV